jgi:phosphate transport system substrate-binding protein
MGVRRSKPLLLTLVIAALAVAAAGCGGGSDEGSSETQAATTETAPAAETTAVTEETGGAVSGSIEADGSSTVGPLTTAAAEMFQAENPDTVVTVGISGTGGGFERFCAGETDLSDASRPIADDEAPICAENGIEYTELQVATDALTVVVNAENDWAECLTVEQLKTIWSPEAEGTITNWNQVDPSFPDEPLVLAGPGTDSGTFDYFTDEINGEEGASRADYTASEDDNVIVQAVSGERGGLGYLGYTYYEENADTLKAVEIDRGAGCVAPSAETAQGGSYTPLARPLFVYVNNEKLTGGNPALAPFVQYYLDNHAAIAEAALYIPMSDEIAAEQQAKLQTALGG